MAYDEQVAQRVGEALSRLSPTPAEPKKMFGGVAYMVQGNMCVGVNEDRLMVRVGPDGYDEALAQTHAQPMDFTGRPMRGFVYVPPEGYAAEDDLEAWVQRGLDFVLTLPAK
jgi:TfoX/Sxy family transcriptional regulator of competence genes